MKTIVRRNLPINVTYKLVDSYYTGGLESGGCSCDNCGKIITNIAVLENPFGERYNVGLDCAETLVSISDLWTVQNNFAELKGITNKIRKAQKENKILKFEFTYYGVVLCFADDTVLLRLDPEFMIKYMPTYMDQIVNKEKLSFRYKNIEFDLGPFKYNKGEFLRPADNKTLTWESFKEGYKVILKVLPYHNTVTGEISGYRFKTAIEKGDILIGEDSDFSNRDLNETLNKIICKWLFNNYDE